MELVNTAADATVGVVSGHLVRIQHQIDSLNNRSVLIEEQVEQNKRNIAETQKAVQAAHPPIEAPEQIKSVYWWQDRR